MNGERDREGDRGESVLSVCVDDDLTGTGQVYKSPSGFGQKMSLTLCRKWGWVFCGLQI